MNLGFETAERVALGHEAAVVITVLSKKKQNLKSIVAFLWRFRRGRPKVASQAFSAPASPKGGRATSPIKLTLLLIQTCH